MKKLWRSTKDSLQFLKLDDDDIDLDEPLEVEEKALPKDTVMKIDLPEGNLKEKLEKNRIRKLRRRLLIAAQAVLIIGGFIMVSLGIIGHYLARIYEEVKGSKNNFVLRNNNMMNANKKVNPNNPVSNAMNRNMFKKF